MDYEKLRRGTAQLRREGPYFSKMYDFLALVCRCFVRKRQKKVKKVKLKFPIFRKREANGGKCQMGQKNKRNKVGGNKRLMDKGIGKRE